jgi:hypothetical protein
MDDLKQDKKEIPSFAAQSGKREIEMQGKGLTAVIYESLNEMNASIKAEIARLESRIEKLEGARL